MEMAALKTEFIDVLAKVLSSIPAGFVFDEVYIIDRLSSEHPGAYLKFCALYADSEKPMEMAADVIRRSIEIFEGVSVAEQKLKVHFPTLYSSLSNHKVWKKI
jgi:hypothetical protein